MKNVKHSRKQTYHDFANGTGCKYMKHIRIFSEENKIDFDVSLKWFLSILVNNPYILDKHPKLKSTKKHYKLFQEVGLTGSNLYDVYKEYEKFKIEIAEDIEYEVKDMKYFTKSVSSEVFNEGFITKCTTVKLVDMLLCIGLIQDRAVDLCDLNNLMTNTDIEVIF